MLKQNDFQAPHASASAEEPGTEQLVSNRSGLGSAASRTHGSRPQNGLSRASKLGISGVAALALIGGLVAPAHAETTTTTPGVTQEDPNTTDPALPPSSGSGGTTGTSGSTGTTTTPTDAAETARQQAEAEAAAKKAAAKKKALAKKKAAAKKKAKQRAKIRKHNAAVKRKRALIARSAVQQVGSYQDCTRVVERALKRIGKHPGDLGTQVRDYTRLGGKRVSAKHKKVGDILIWPGRHVAVYTGHGKAVHGGYGGYRTVKAAANVQPGKPIVVRYSKVKHPS